MRNGIDVSKLPDTITYYSYKDAQGVKQTTTNEADAFADPANEYLGSVTTDKNGNMLGGSGIGKRDPNQPPLSAMQSYAGLPSAETLAAEATHPQATAPATPVVDEQTAAPGDAPDSLPNPTSHGTAVHGGPFNPSRDTTKFDDLGNEKGDIGTFGPRGTNVPGDVKAQEDRQAESDAADRKLGKNMAPTSGIDSTGKPKGAFQVTPGGYDKNGAKIPDIVDYSKPLDPPAPHLGPRGSGAPQDCFHGTRPKKQS